MNSNGKVKIWTTIEYSSAIKSLVILPHFSGCKRDVISLALTQKFAQPASVHAKLLKANVHAYCLRKFYSSVFFFLLFCSRLRNINLWVCDISFTILFWHIIPFWFVFGTLHILHMCALRPNQIVATCTKQIAHIYLYEIIQMREDIHTWIYKMSSFARTDRQLHTYEFQQITNGREIIIILYIVNFSSIYPWCSWNKSNGWKMRIWDATMWSPTSHFPKYVDEQRCILHSWAMSLSIHIAMCTIWMLDGAKRNAK